MGNHETVRLMTPGQFKELQAAVTEQIPSDLSFDRVLRGSELPAEVINEWIGFYQKIGIEVDLSGLILPDYEKGFDRLLVIPKGLTLNPVWAACQKVFDGKTWSAYGNDLDGNVPTNDRVPTTSYAIRVRDRVEADEELKNLSANDLSKKKIAGITLLERLVYEQKYFHETGGHLDLSNWTLCSGSRHSGGLVPDVHWYSDVKLYVNWCSPGNHDARLRARAVVSA
ncbi:MAG: hypothetical protein HY093_01215 [Candidatus Liptonbacteria bacterium]|nr:hypothetical protein [Candidatus Liptonbacteria bacterium]